MGIGNGFNNSFSINIDTIFDSETMKSTMMISKFRISSLLSLIEKVINLNHLILTILTVWNFGRSMASIWNLNTFLADILLKIKVELFNHLKNNPENILKDPFSQRPVLDPDFLSIYLDFGRDMELGIYDNNLTADSVIALRIAFKFFIDGGSYEMDFNGFRQNIYGLFNVNDTIKSLAKFEYIMNLNHVIQSIRESRQLKDNQILPPY
ncbi:5248_t:CDS:2 [Rhizophagus irregularis]|nr:5248_t:CDS:2 [Rhizophagus irregularis]